MLSTLHIISPCAGFHLSLENFLHLSQLNQGVLKSTPAWRWAWSRSCPNRRSSASPSPTWRRPRESSTPPGDQQGLHQHSSPGVQTYYYSDSSRRSQCKHTSRAYGQWVSGHQYIWWPHYSSTDWWWRDGHWPSWLEPMERWPRSRHSEHEWSYLLHKWHSRQFS